RQPWVFEVDAQERDARGIRLGRSGRKEVFARDVVDVALAAKGADWTERVPRDAETRLDGRPCPIERRRIGIGRVPALMEVASALRELRPRRTVVATFLEERDVEAAAIVLVRPDAHRSLELRRGLPAVPFRGARRARETFDPRR